MDGFKKLLFPLLAALLLLPAIGGCGRTEVTEEFFQSYKVRSGTVLEIYNPNGEITVSGWDNEEVEISALKSSYHGREALDEVDIYIDIAETMSIWTDHPDNDRQVTVSYEIKVPEDLLVGVIECINGDIKLQDVGGNPVLLTSNGAITAHDVNGIVTALSSNGDLTVTGAKSLGALRTSNGDIEADLPSLHEDLEIRTSNGSIKLFIDPSLSADIEAETSNGTINLGNLEIETTLLEQTALRGSMNEGGHKVSLITSNGSIKLDRLR